MEAKRTTLGVAMRLVALAAVDLAFLRAPLELLLWPHCFFMIVALNLVLVQGVVLGRPLRLFHAAFLVAGVVASIALTAYIASTGRVILAPWFLELGVRVYHRLSGDMRVFQFNNSAWILHAELLVADGVGLLVAWGSGLLVSRTFRTRGDRPIGRILTTIGDFLAGAVIGLVLHGVVAALLRWSWPDRPRAPWFLIPMMVMLVTIGGMITCVVRRHQRRRSGGLAGEPGTMILPVVTAGASTGDGA